MYIENTTNNVREFFEKLDNVNDETKIKLLLYVLNSINNNQINDKNIANPDLIDDDDINIFNMECIGIDPSYCNQFLQSNIMIFNNMNNDNNAYDDRGNLLGVEYNKEEKNLLSTFEKLSFEEKLDVIAEIIIKYDNQTYINKPVSISFNNKSGFDIANSIMNYKKNFKS